MKFYDIIYEIAEKRGLTIEKVCDVIGRTPNYIYVLKSRGSDPHLNTASMILKAVGYKICLVPEELEVPDGVYIIE